MTHNKYIHFKRRCMGSCALVDSVQILLIQCRTTTPANPGTRKRLLCVDEREELHDWTCQDGNGIFKSYIKYNQPCVFNYEPLSPCSFTTAFSAVFKSKPTRVMSPGEGRRQRRRRKPRRPNRGHKREVHLLYTLNISILTIVIVVKRDYLSDITLTGCQILHYIIFHHSV